MSLPTVGGLGERALIERILGRLPQAPPWVVVGPGDDAAVVEPERNRLDVLATDALVEGVHFDRRYVPADAIGHKALAVNLSDLAAMGAAPRAALLSLALPSSLPLDEIDRLVDGLLGLASRYRVAVIGGNITGSPGPLVVDLTVLGSVHRRRIPRRSGARPGDELFVSGEIGSAAAGRQALAAGRAAGLDDCVSRFLRPEPRLRLGILAGRTQAVTSCIALSDGLADGVRQVAAASDVGVEIDEGAVPMSGAARRWFEAEGLDPIDEALGGGEDYELLFTVPRRRHRAFDAVVRLAGVPCVRIGRVGAGPGTVLRTAAGSRPLPDGFAHLR